MSCVEGQALQVRYFSVSHASRRQRGGVVLRALAVAAVVVLAGLVWLWADPEARTQLRREAEIAALEQVGNIAAQRMTDAGASQKANLGSAVDLINRPIEVIKVSDRVHYASGVGNTVMVATDDGVVIFDTGLIIQSARQLKLLRETVSEAPARFVVLSHAHADHVGGTRLWLESDTVIVTHEEFAEEQRYLTELDPYFQARNRTLFPWIPEQTSDLALLNFRGIEPDITVDNDEPFGFELGGMRFEAIAAPGAEGDNSLLLWLPDQRILLSGDFFGPQFPQFPNVFTMRGEKVRKPVEYIESLNRLLALRPDVIVPSHLAPVTGEAQIAEGMTRIRDAVQYVHDQTVAGMNAGRTVYELMAEITLPPELDLVQNHGKVSWAVRSIWEYYATWFHFDSTTELYAVPARAIHEDLAALAGIEPLLRQVRSYLDEGAWEKALHGLEIALAAEPSSLAAQEMRTEALNGLLARAEAGAGNDYEIYWLQSRLRQSEDAIQAALAANNSSQ